MILRRDQGARVAHALVEVDGFLTDDDPRLAGLDAALRRPVVLGAYAVPETGGSRMTAPRPRPEILDISPYVGGESTVPGVNRVLKLSSNEGAFGVPPARRRHTGARPRSCTAIRTATPPSCGGRSARGSGSIRRGSSAARDRTT